MTLHEQDAINIMKKGYCLWIGAGVTRYLSKAGGELTPMWPELVKEMEKETGINKPIPNTTYSQRLEIVQRSIGYEKFQFILRKKILNQLAYSIIKYAKRKVKSEDIIPKEVKQLAKLGMLANPIVNFNIETLTSFAVARSGGPISIKCFNPPVPGAIRDTYIGQETATEQFKRNVYHPHGALNLYGTCVLTENEYKSLLGTLSFQLAVHSGFMSFLVIVGMSLEDEYLRKQISSFRSQIREIIWFTTKKPSDEDLKWISIHNIKIVKIKSWNYFWNDFVDQLPSPTAKELLISWQDIINIAFYYLEQKESFNTFLSMFKKQGLTDIQLSKENQLALNQGLCFDDETDYNYTNDDKTKILGSIVKKLIKD